MELTGLHLLLTYQCTFECEHCFVFGSPRQRGTMSLEQIEEILRQGRELGSVKSIYFEGGEPFLYYAVLLAGVRRAADAGFEVGIVTNGYWATSESDAAEWLAPMAGALSSLTLSSDRFHEGRHESDHAANAQAAAERLGISTGVICIEQPPDGHEDTSADEWDVMFRGRAAERLACRVHPQPWEGFGECPCEDLRNPGRVHIDPLGFVHLCQGITLGNLFRRPLAELCESYDPDTHPVAGPLLAGGPAELVRRYGLDHDEGYADACHLCYSARKMLRERLGDALGPDQAYGE